MRMVPPDDVYIPSTLAPEESTKSPGEITMAPEESTLAPEDTTLIASEEISSTTSNMETDTTEVLLYKFSKISKFVSFLDFSIKTF